MCKLLIAEDSELWQKLLQDDLSALPDTEVYCTDNGKGAIDMLKDNSFDYAIIDIFLPEVSGVGIINWSMKNHVRTKFLFLTGLDKESDLGKLISIMEKNKKIPLKKVIFKNSNNIIGQCREILN